MSGNFSTPWKARPTIYKGIEMRSRLEAHWAEAFDTADIEWEYEPCAFGDASGQYLPDFRYYEDRPGGRRKTVYLEVKGVLSNPEPVCQRMEIIWASEPDATLIVAENHMERYYLGLRRKNGDPIWVRHEMGAAA